MKMFFSFWGLTDLCLQRNLLFPQGPAQASIPWFCVGSLPFNWPSLWKCSLPHLNGAEKQDSLLEDGHRARC